MTSITVVNIIPNSHSSEQNQDSEPSIAVNPNNPKEIVITAFTPPDSGVSNGPIFYSSDGGLTWVLNFTIPNGETRDQSIGFGTTSGELYAAGLHGSPTTFQVYRTADPSAAGTWPVFDSRSNIDQPWVEARTVVGGTDNGKDRLYVAYNDDNLSKSAAIDICVDALAASPSFVQALLESRNVGSGLADGYAIRPVAHSDGTVYAVYEGWRSGSYGSDITTDIVVVRDDNWGKGASPFTNLTDPSDNLSGRIVATGVVINDGGIMGQERLNNDLTIAVDPTDSGTVYVAWADNAGPNYTIRVRRSTNRGADWSGDLITIDNATMAGLAINSEGVVGLMYQELNNNNWETHFRRTTDSSGVNWDDNTLCVTPSAVPAISFQPYLGDWARVVSVGKDFYGVFCANNTPDPANFPNGVSFKRNHTTTAPYTLLGNDNTTTIGVSIDPFFFHIAEVPGMTLIIDKSNYGFSEVDTLMSGGEAILPPASASSPAFWLSFSDFAIAPVLTDIQFGGLPSGMRPVNPAVTSLPGSIYLVAYYMEFDASTVSTSSGIFPPAGNLPTKLILTATYTPSSGAPLSASGILELASGADPYFLNVNSSASNPACFSQDLGVFMLNSTAKKLAGTSTSLNTSTPDPNTYITDLLTELNGNVSTGNTALNNIIPPDTDLNLYPYTGSGTGDPNYAFAIARVRLNGNTPASVRVFFRLFITSTGDTDFSTSIYNETFQQGGGTIPASQSGCSSSDSGPVANGQQTTTAQPIPLLGTASGDVITIPFFANNRVSALPMTDQTDCANVRTIAAPSGDDTNYAFFGCYIDYFNGTVNGMSIWELMQSPTALHCCIVAEIYYPTVPPLSGTSCYDSSQLAQRNLVISSSPNPGLDNSRKIPLTFDVRPTSQALANVYPDELMIDWGKVPAGSIANIYWPQVPAADVLNLAKRYYPSPIALTMQDSHTIQCAISEKISFIPIPAGAAGGPNFAGLITVNLPGTVKKGDLYTAIVYRLTTRSHEVTNDTAFIYGRSFSWRYVVGSFQINIPVSTKELLIDNEERALSILKWKLSKMATSNRWYKVILRYIEELYGKIEGMGGNPGKVGPSKGGGIIHLPGDTGTGAGTGAGGTGKLPGAVLAFMKHTGKVAGLIYNHFGDFEGFVLEDMEAEERVFYSREKEIEIIVERAWRERTLVCVHRTDLDKVSKIILLTSAKPI